MSTVRGQMEPDAFVLYSTASGSMAPGEAFRVSIWAHGLGDFAARPAVRDTI